MWWAVAIASAGVDLVAAGAALSAMDRVRCDSRAVAIASAGVALAAGAAMGAIVRAGVALAAGAAMGAIARVVCDGQAAVARVRAPMAVHLCRGPRVPVVVLQVRGNL